MAGDVKQRMAAGAAQLLARNGLQATSFSEVLEFTGAPRGSIYHHFPDGKDQLVAAALEIAGERATTLIEQWHGRTPAEVTAAFLGVWRAVLTHSNFESGCAVVAVTVASDSPALISQSAEIFRGWRTQLATLLAEGGHPSPDAFAALLVAASEGAVVVARAERSLDPFELVAAQLVEQAG